MTQNQLDRLLHDLCGSEAVCTEVRETDPLAATEPASKGSPPWAAQPSGEDDLPARPLEALTYLELLELDLPPKRYLLEPWLPERGLAMVAAPRGIGKTHFALGVAYAVGSGGSFLRFRVPAARAVLYIDGEMPLQAMQERVAAIVRGATDKIVRPEFLRFLCSDTLDGGMPDLGTDEGQRQLAPLVDTAELIIIDNISTLVRTGGENDSDSWRPVQKWALEQRRAGRAVLFIHHTNKSGEQRGTSKREDVLDSVLSLSPPASFEDNEGAWFVVRFEKARGFYGEDADAVEARYTVKEGAANWTYGPPVRADDAMYQKAVELFKQGLSVREAAARLPISKSAVGRYHKEWLESHSEPMPVPASQPIA
jgi:hypothetical protein